MKNIPFALMLCAAGCGGSGAPAPEYRTATTSAGDAARVLDYGDIEKYKGGRVTVEGVFDHIRHEHGIVVLDGGLKVYVPNISLHLRGEPWHDYVGRRVVAAGVLRTYTKELPAYHGPSIDIDYFRVLEQ